MSKTYNNFIQYLSKKDDKLELVLGTNELKYLKNLLMATISRNLWGNDAYYQVLSQEDEYIQRAINEF